MNKGCFHLYCGDGKGKTTAAMGLALRALGHGRSVVIVQFLKSGSSGELEPLRRLGAQVFSGKGCGKFSRQMNEEEKKEAAALHKEHLQLAVSLKPDLLILDEACAALRAGLLEEPLLKQVILDRPEGQEIVVTGRRPAEWMTEAADYITEMKCRRHPFETGLPAREGVEF